MTHKDQQKTWLRGADSQTMMEQAPRRKTNLFKNKAKTNETNDKKTKFPVAKINPIDKTPKTKEKPLKTTTVHGKTTKTKQNFSYKTNQIGNCANQLARKKFNGMNQEETNIPVWICCKLITFNPPQRLQYSC